jgi:hypothetical protein
MTNTTERQNLDTVLAKQATDLTLEDCMMLAKFGKIVEEDPTFEDWWHGGDKFDLNIWTDSDSDKPEYINLAVYTLDLKGLRDPAQSWTIKYEDSKHWF